MPRVIHGAFFITKDRKLGFDFGSRACHIVGMETTGINEEELNKKGEFLRFDRKFITRCGDECNIPLYSNTGTETKENYTKYGYLAASREALLKRVAEKKLPPLYFHSSDRPKLYEMTAKNCLDNLDELLRDPDVINDEKVAELVVDWVDVSLEEISSTNKFDATKHLKTFVERMLGGYKEKGLSGLMSEVKKLDYSTAQHSVETMVYTLNYLRSLPSRNKDFDEVGAMAALLHDIGKQYVNKEILLKPDRLTDEEFKIVMKHPMDGQAILKGIKFSGPGGLGYSPDVEKFIMDAVGQHHEKEDGKGYPNGLKGDEISPYGKILGIIDIYAAITSRLREYREPFTQEQAIAELNRLVNDKKTG